MISTIQETKQDKVFLAFVYLILTVALVIVAYPLIYIVSASITNPNLVASGDMWLLPKDITFEGYRRVFQDTSIWRGYMNTIIYTVVGTLVNLIFTLPAAYALSRRDFVGRNIFMMIFMVTMFFGGGLVPTYLVVRSLGLVDSMWALILPGATSIWNLIVCRTFFQSSIPRELQEAAEIDGCSNFRLFFRIVLPLSSALIAVMALFFGVGHWNNYFSAMIYLNHQEKYPLQLVLRQILVLQQMSAQAGTIDASMATSLNNKAEVAALVKYAVIIVATLPIIAVYPFLQRYFVQGVMIGSVKG
ncbi:carbohydrate ABC transporter permease [Saccharibacillus sp. CPCC 101409]|uniref:carbohydrate ABC transporter permease n=1 Tax=Saccharibacillus sp. CPCC 101409 TaxID=3058041 RepID=UPI0026713A91|nr:carbohydrate ABC transporter permease [Saccharibacillus sp. CPCC 101409]MDO3411731.1 carbohydrate ABC transporter permease [Saccharibacillus sp. CPCC 101409]